MPVVTRILSSLIRPVFKKKKKEHSSCFPFTMLDGSWLHGEHEEKSSLSSGARQSWVQVQLSPVTLSE